MSSHGDSEQNRYIPIGNVSKSHGIKGEVKIYLFSECPDDFNNYQDIFLAAPGKTEALAYRVKRHRNQGKMAIVELDGVTGREQAEALRGLEVRISEDLLPPLENDEFYWHEMQGLKVVTESGYKLGKVASIFAGGGHDILVVRGMGKEYLIPAQHEFIASIDYETGTITIVTIPGLLEINE